jgi:hypothetical protein
VFNRYNNKTREIKFTLRDSLLFIENIKIKFEEGGPGIDFARSKLKNVLSKNRGYYALKKINGLINGEVIGCGENEELSVEDLSSVKYAPIVSCDVERSFSKYKSMLRDNRKSFQFENLKSYLLIHAGTRPVIIIYNIFILTQCH